MAINTHGLTINFGKHRGELFTRLPVSYLKWMINSATPQADIAKAEFERRGDTLPKVELTGHAIDNASIRVGKIWRATKLNDEEGIYSWLQRMTLEALSNGEKLKGKIMYKGMKFVVEEGDEYPVLKTIMKQ